MRQKGKFLLRFIAFPSLLLLVGYLFLTRAAINSSWLVAALHYLTVLLMLLFGVLMFVIRDLPNR